MMVGPMAGAEFCSATASRLLHKASVFLVCVLPKIPTSGNFGQKWGTRDHLGCGNYWIQVRFIMTV